MRQVDHDELVHLLASGLRRLTSTQVKALQHWDGAQALRARLDVADALAASFYRFEILTAAPPPPPFHYPDAPDETDR